MHKDGQVGCNLVNETSPAEFTVPYDFHPYLLSFLMRTCDFALVSRHFS